MGHKLSKEELREKLEAAKKDEGKIKKEMEEQRRAPKDEVLYANFSI